MTRDDYRKYQKEQCVRGNGRSKNGKYGCYCCRKIAALGTFKKVCRRRARTLFKRETLKVLKETA